MYQFEPLVKEWAFPVVNYFAPRRRNKNTKLAKYIGKDWNG
jgi:hypothetical protein